MNTKKNYFINKFIVSFSNIKTDKKQKRIIKFINNSKKFLWQIPIENFGEYLEGTKAKEAYDIINKNDAFEIVVDGPFSDKAPIPLKKEHLTSLSIKNSGVCELYIFDLDFNWCYVITHEDEGCGPFFFKKVL